MRPLLRVDLTGLVESTLRIRRGEGRLVALMFLYSMAVVSTFIIGRTVASTLFLRRVSPSKLALMYVVVAIAVAAVSFGYGKIADKFRRDRLVMGSLITFISVASLIWAALFFELAGDWLYPVFYVQVEVAGALAIIQFWTFANDIFSARQAKRLFGLIGAGGVLANIICGFAIGTVAPVIGPINLILVAVALFGLSYGCVRKISLEARSDLEAALHRPKRKGGLKADTGAVLHSKHLKLIAAIVVLTFLSTTLIDYQFKVLARSAFHDERALAAYFGNFFGYTGILASLVQFFLTGRILERTGIVVALAILPSALLLGAGSLLLVPYLLAGITAATLAKSAENIFRYTINDATMQVLYVPVPSHQRGRSKAFIDGMLKPTSIGVMGLAVWAAGFWMDAETLALRLVWVDLLLLAAWLGLVLRTRKEYVQSLIENLQERRFDLSSGTWAVDEATVRTLKARLFADDETHVLHALELLPTLEADFHSELVKLLDHPSPAIRIAVLRQVGASGRLDSGPAIQARLDDTDPEVRSAAIAAFCALGRERAIRAASPFLADKDPRVRGAAVAALIQHGGLDGILTAAEPLKSLLASVGAPERLEGARVLREIRVKSFFQPVLELLEDREPRVRIAAAEAAGEMLSPELIPKLVYKLGDAAVAQSAARALICYGISIEPVLIKVLLNPNEDLSIRRKVPKILGHIGNRSALLALLESLGQLDPELRTQAARAAARIRERHAALPVNEPQLTEVLMAEIAACYQLLATLTDLALPPDHLLAEALQGRFRAKLSLIFRLLEIRYPARTIQLVYINLSAENKAVRANALEVVDNLLSREEARLLMPLLEDHPAEERLAIGQESLQLQRMSRAAWLERLLDDPHPWTVACTLTLLTEAPRNDLSAKVLQHLQHRDVIVRETACFSLRPLLQQLAESAWRPLVEKLAKEDQAPEVRRASQQLLS